MASLQKLPPVIPAINTKAWKALTDISQKLNRIAIHIDGKSKDSQLTHTELFAVKRQLEELRHNLFKNRFFGVSLVKGMRKIKRGKSFAGVCPVCIEARFSSLKVFPIIIGGNMLS
ncbi:Uncharacterised protein [Salmonella enterica subsp. enterica serovar Heidelberg]|nr:Uncharacterised protein [Salmonella enterica subsp. enterica serovar Heidelberg]